MSETSKKDAQYIKKLYEQVSETSKEAQTWIPDKQLGEKLKKVQESSKEVVKHIEERLGK